MAFGRSVKPKVIVTGMPKSGTTAVAMLLGVAAGVKTSSDPLTRLDQVGIEFRDDLYAGRLRLGDLIEAHCRLFRLPIVKDPNFIFFVEDLIDLWPQARWVFTVRDPRANIRSLLNRVGMPGVGERANEIPDTVGETWRRVLEGRTPEIPGDTVIERLAHRWVAIATLARTCGIHMNVLRYEDFMSDKESSIRELSGGVGLCASRSIRHAMNRQFQPMGNRAVGQLEFFGHENLAIIEKVCANEMACYGYLLQAAE